MANTFYQRCTNTVTAVFTKHNIELFYIYLPFSYLQILNFDS